MRCLHTAAGSAAQIRQHACRLIFCRLQPRGATPRSTSWKRQKPNRYPPARASLCPKCCQPNGATVSTSRGAATPPLRPQRQPPPTKAAGVCEFRIAATALPPARRNAQGVCASESAIQRPANCRPCQIRWQPPDPRHLHVSFGGRAAQQRPRFFQSLPRPHSKALSAEAQAQRLLRAEAAVCLAFRPTGHNLRKELMTVGFLGLGGGYKAACSACRDNASFSAGVKSG